LSKLWFFLIEFPLLKDWWIGLSSPASSPLVFAAIRASCCARRSARVSCCLGAEVCPAFSLSKRCAAFRCSFAASAAAFTASLASPLPPGTGVPDDPLLDAFEAWRCKAIVLCACVALVSKPIGGAAISCAESKAKDPDPLDCLP
jgi:hypothetical protein